MGVEGLGGCVVAGGVGLNGGWRGVHREKDDRDGCKGLRRRGRHAGASPKLLGNAATQSGETPKERGSRERRKKPCLEWRDLAGLRLLCLSGSRLQRQRKSKNVQAWSCMVPVDGDERVLPRLRKKDQREREKSTCGGMENSASEGSAVEETKQRDKTSDFSPFE